MITIRVNTPEELKQAYDDPMYAYAEAASWRNLDKGLADHWMQIKMGHWGAAPYIPWVPDEGRFLMAIRVTLHR